MGDITVSNKQEAHVVAQAPTVDLNQLAKLSPDAQRRNDGSWHSIVASGGKIDVRFQRHAANGQAVYEAKGEKSTVKIVAKSFEAAEEKAKQLVANGSLAPRDDGQPKWPIPDLPVVEKTRPAAPPVASADKPIQGKTSWNKTQRVPPLAKRAWVPDPGFRGAENVRATEATASWSMTQRVPPSAKAGFPDPGFGSSGSLATTSINSVPPAGATNSSRPLDPSRGTALSARDRAAGDKAKTPAVSGAQAPRVSPLAAQKPNTPSPTPLTFAPLVYTAIGSQRPLSALGNATSGTLLNAVKAKVPGSAPLISALQNILPKGKQTGADLMRLEMNTLVSDKTSVVHVKFNLAQLAKGPSGPSDKVFSTLLDVARTPTQKAQVIAAKQMFDANRRQPAFAQSHFAKYTDLRVTFDVPETSGFRVGTMTLPTVNSSKNGWVAATGVSPRLKFDASGKLAGGQLIVAVEVDTPDTKRAAMWAGIGAGGIVQWDGNASKSPIRQDARGHLGVEFKVGKEVKFLKVPYLRETLQGAGMAKAENFRVSQAPAISSEVFARDVLHTNDPKVIKSLKDGAELAEKTGDVVSTATQVVGTVSQLASAAGAVAQVVGLPAALLSVPAFFLLPQDRVADATPSGMFKTKYHDDVKRAVDDLNTIDFMLKRKSPLFPVERSRLNDAVVRYLATARNYYWTERNAVERYVPASHRFPQFSEKAVISVENAVRRKYPDFRF